MRIVVHPINHIFFTFDPQNPDIPFNTLNPSNPMSGIYTHIPFCRQACHYCNFHFSVSKRNREAFLDALIREMSMQANFFRDIGETGKIRTVYLGGGTPSVPGNNELTRLFHHLDKVFSISGAEEITLEANPDDLNREKLLFLRDTPVNRLSIGVQSFHDNDLRYMNRLHSPAQAVRSIELAQQLGFDRLTVDLIYGTPTMNDLQWKENLHRVIDMGVPHISAYALTVEEKTVLHYLIQKGRAKGVSDEQSARQFELMCAALSDAGYAHYEVSNFGRSGHFGLHNLSYWTGQAYLGLGPSAHSFTGQHRLWNPANTSLYIQSIQDDKHPGSGETLSVEQACNEYVMTSLRTMWGCDLSRIRDLYGEYPARQVEKNAARHQQQGMLNMSDNHLFVTQRGKFFTDGIAADLFINDEMTK